MTLFKWQNRDLEEKFFAESAGQGILSVISLVWINISGGLHYDNSCKG